MELDLDAIEARANAATEGPWWRREGHAEIDGQNYAEVLIPGRVECGSYCYGGTSTIEGDRLDADLAFIAHARADVPALVAEVRRLREEAEVDAGLIRSIIAAREHVERTLTAERDDARAAIARVQALHYPVPDWNGGVRCHICDDSSTTDGAYPCPTIRAIDGTA